MPKDWKIGLVTGFILASLGAIWFCTNPQQNNNAASPGENSEAVTFNDTAKPAKNFSASNELSQTFTEPASLKLTSSQGLEITAEPKPLPAQKPVRLYTVQKGDTLSLIAEKVYSDKNMWHKIRDANKIKNVNALRPGTELIIP